MIASGAQIKAARALLNWKQTDLAAAAQLHENAVAYWERVDVIPSQRRSKSVGLFDIERALKAAGVETFMNPTPGVRFVSHRQQVRPPARRGDSDRLTPSMSAVEIIATLKRSGTVH